MCVCHASGRSVAQPPKAKPRSSPIRRSGLSCLTAESEAAKRTARSAARLSIRRACRALPVERSTYHYRSRRAGQAQLTERIKEIAATRVRYGYRRIHVLLRREGWRVNAKRVYRLYREMDLAIAQQNTPAPKAIAGCTAFAAILANQFSPEAAATK